MHSLWSHPAAAALIPALRAFVRYAPASSAKHAVWDAVIAPYLAWHDHRFTAETDAGRIRGTTRDILQQYLYYFGTWEPQVSAFVRGRLRPGDGFLDVGANIGYFSLLAARRVGRRGRVVSVEASPSIHAALAANVRRNRAPVRTVHAAAAATRGTLRLYAGDSGNCGATTLADVGGTPEAEVPAAPLDDILSAEEAGRMRLVKIDVEGAEAGVVAGMAKLLADGRRDLELLVEIHPRLLATLGQTPDDVFRPLAAAGFHPYALDNDYDATSYLWPSPAARPRRLRAPLEWDANVVFARADAEEI